MMIILFLLLPLFALGQTTFNRTYDYDFSPNNGLCVLELPDGYLLGGTGRDYSIAGWSKLILIKTDLNGDTIWLRAFGAPSQGHAFTYQGALIQTSDSGFLACGGHYDSINDVTSGLLMKFNAQGDSVWAKKYANSPTKTTFNAVAETADHGFVAVGYTHTGLISSSRPYLLKTDSLGLVEWDTIYPWWSSPTSIAIATDGNYLMGGQTIRPDPAITKIDTNGHVVWRSFYGTPRQDPCFAGIAPCMNGDILLYSCLDSVVNQGDYPNLPFLARYAPDGSIKWVKHFNNPNNRIINITRAKELRNGNLMLVGERGDDVNTAMGWILLMDSLGNQIWERKHGYTQDSAIYGLFGLVYDFAYTSDNGYILTGISFNDVDTSFLFNMNADFWLLKLDSLGNWDQPMDTLCPPPCDTTQPCLPPCDTINPCLEPCDTVGISAYALGQIMVYPNPAHQQLQIALPDGQTGVQFQLFTLLGHAVLQQEIKQSTSLDISGLTPGVYLYQLSSHESTRYGKLVVE